MLGYKFKDSFSFLPESRAGKRLYDITLISARELLRHNRRSNSLAVVLTPHFRPAFNNIHTSKHLKLLEKQIPILPLWVTHISHPGSSRLWLKAESRFVGDRCHFLAFCDQGESFSTSSQPISCPSNFVIQPSTASHHPTEHSKMIFSHQKPEESLRHEIRSRVSESSQPSEEALAALLICSQRLMFLCIFLQKKVPRSPFGRTIHKSTIMSAYLWR